jgi:hypothetical protein
MLGSYGGNKINEEGKTVECENERDNPFQHSCCVIRFLEIAASEGDGEYHLNEDKGEFDPEGDAEDSMLAEIFGVRMLASTFGERDFGGGRKGNVRIPKRWYSQHTKIAEMTYPAINRRRKMSWRVLCLSVSKIDRSIKPAVPIAANTKLRPDTILPVLLNASRRPRCRSKRSERKDRSRNIVVTQAPAMNRGLRDSAATAEIAQLAITRNS